MKPLEFPFFPFVLFILSPLKFFASNTGLFDEMNVIRLLAFLLAICGVLFAVLWLVTRRRALAAFTTALLPIIVYELRPVPIDLVGVLISAALVGYLIRNLGLTRQAVIIANVVSLSLLITPLSKIAGAGVFSARSVAEPLRFGPLAELGPDAFAAGFSPPSVVHIVLDGYGGRTALIRMFGYDNAAFSDALGALGFTVMEDVSVPYNQTLLAMSAVMNADFPPIGQPPLSEMTGDTLRAALARTVIESAVIRGFREQGHKITYTVTGYNFFRYPEYAQLITTPPGVFELSQFDISFLLLRLGRWGGHLLEPAAMSAPLDRLVKSALSREIVDELHPPFFLYSHVLAPHPPFTMDRNGNPTNRWGFSLLSDGDHALGNDESLRALYREGYLEKLRYTNKAVLAQVKRIIEEIEGPLVIIIHGDHGSGSRLIQDSAERTCLMERMRTTVAIYSNVPEISNAVATGGIDNTINIYRVIFAALLGREIPRTEGQYFAKWITPSESSSLAGAEFDRNCS